MPVDALQEKLWSKYYLEFFFPEKTNAKNPDFQKFKNKYVLQF